MNGEGVGSSSTGGGTDLENFMEMEEAKQPTRTDTEATLRMDEDTIEKIASSMKQGASTEQESAKQETANKASDMSPSNLQLCRAVHLDPAGTPSPDPNQNPQVPQPEPASDQNPQVPQPAEPASDQKPQVPHPAADPASDQKPQVPHPADPASDQKPQVPQPAPASDQKPQVPQPAPASEQQGNEQQQTPSGLKLQQCKQEQDDQPDTNIQKSTTNQEKEVYVWKTRAGLEAQLGAELTADLDMQLFKCFSHIEDVKKQALQTEGEMQMEKVLEEVPGETDRGRLLPKPKKEAKPKKEKTWKEIGTEEFAWLDAILGDPADPVKRVPGRLPFIDPHEYLEYLWRSGRADFTDDDVLPPS
eukprot:s488_g3.t1